MNEIYIYALKDPENNEIKYIGKTNNIKRRYNNHLQEVNKGINTKKVNWIRKLKENNTKPILEVLEICCDINWQDREMYWIDIINPKCNQTKGGGGQITTNSDYIKKISTSVLQYNLYGDLINEFESLNEASRNTGIATPNISRACNGILKHAGFFIWKFKDIEIVNNNSKLSRIKNKKRVIQIDKSGNIISEYASIRDAATINNFNRKAIYNCCLNNITNSYSTSSGYIWKYIDDIIYI